MENSFFRHNSADQDKRLDAELLSVEGLSVYRPKVSVAESSDFAGRKPFNTVFGESVIGWVEKF